MGDAEVLLKVAHEAQPGGPEIVSQEMPDLMTSWW